jgi:hypothetical protein
LFRANVIFLFPLSFVCTYYSILLCRTCQHGPCMTIMTTIRLPRHRAEEQGTILLILRPLKPHLLNSYLNHQVIVKHQYCQKKYRHAFQALAEQPFLLCPIPMHILQMQKGMAASTCANSIGQKCLERSGSSPSCFIRYHLKNKVRPLCLSRCKHQFRNYA